MGVLLAGLDNTVTEILVRRLVDAGDEARVVEPDPRRVRALRALGARVAPGDPSDGDLLERAALGARTVVVGDAFRGGASLEAALGALGASRDPPRLVYVGRRAGVAARLARGAGLRDYVVLAVPGGLRRLRRPLASAELAEAVEAADDLPGEVRLVIDLSSEPDRRRLGLESS